MTTQAEANIAAFKGWLDAHNNLDMKVLDFMTDDVEIVEIAGGIVYRGRERMEKLARMAFRGKGYKKLTHIMATDTHVCAEYDSYTDMAAIGESERKEGVHGIDVSKAKDKGQRVVLKVCFVAEMKDGKIYRAREYYDVSTMTRQMGIADPMSSILKFIMKLMGGRKE